MLFNFTSVPPLSLYIHLPWCVRKCPYCDFNSHQSGSGVPEDAYIDALMRDLEQELPLIWGRQIESVFIGGGTPSLFSGKAIDRLLSQLRAYLNIWPNVEITMEANPGTFEAERFAEYREAGINRLSIGIQSFNPLQLEKLGRIHNGNEAHRAVEIARTAGFTNINLDLMFALPGQDLAAARADIEAAISHEPTHISYYQLTLEPNTPFYAQPPLLPDDDLSWAIQQQGQQLLAEAGYGHYETSAYAKDGFRCKHNLNYWRFGDYVGIGAGAHGKITLPAEQRIQRRWRVRTPQTFMEKAGTDQAYRAEMIGVKDVGFEFMLNALRLTEGFESTLFPERAGRPLSDIAKPLQLAQDKGLIEWDAFHIKPTELGQQYLNDVMEMFLPDK